MNAREDFRGIVVAAPRCGWRRRRLAVQQARASKLALATCATVGSGSRPLLSSHVANDSSATGSEAAVPLFPSL